MRDWSAKKVGTCYVPWGKDVDWQFVMYSINKALSVINADAEYFHEYFNQSLAFMVYHANRMEQTIHHNVSEGKTQLLINGFVDGTAQPPPAVAWNAEGGRDQTIPSSDRQLYQFMLAARYLCEENVNEELTVPMICKCHEIMMSGSTEGGENTPMGIRTTLANAGMFVFIAPQHVRNGLDAMLRSYREARDGGMHPIELATQLFYDCITIHPFCNGNGRLCRLLMSWSLMRDGFPFYVSFSTGHRCRKQHYMHAIHTARVPVVGHRRELNCILLESCQRTLGNYLANAKAGGLDD